MERLLKIVIIVISLVSILIVTSPNISRAKTNNSTEYITTVDKSDLFKIIRVLENGKWYIYIYTDSGIFVSKFEEL